VLELLDRRVPHGEQAVSDVILDPELIVRDERILDRPPRDLAPRTAAELEGARPVLEMGSPDFVRYADVDHRPRALAQLELAKEQLKQTVVRAPRAGRVLRIQASPGEVTGPKPILQLGDTRRMYVVAEVDEGQIPFVEKGQEATIKCLDLRASTYTGKVESRALMVLKNDILGLDPAAAYARVVEVKIKVDEPCDPLRDLTNTQVSVDIATQVPAGRGRAALGAPAPSR
jgi:ABC exporter DevB family membrane fusion protein